VSPGHALDAHSPMEPPIALTGMVHFPMDGTLIWNGPIHITDILARPWTDRMWRPLSSTGQKRLARVPEGIRIYAIGDVHGRADLLDQLFSGIDADLAMNPIPRAIQVLLGDYVDRGPASREVLDILIERGRRHAMVYLRGNHEVFLEEFLGHPEIFAEWRQFGGIETLLSYGIRPSFNPDASEQKMLASALTSVLPHTHREFLRRLRPSFTCGDFFFVHAGVRPGIPLAHQKDEDLFWIRDDFLRCEEEFDKIIVHGHTPVDDVEFYPNRVNIDTGAYATGRLTCLRIERDIVLFFAGTRVRGRRVYVPTRRNA
jgi:calcineurin-like phosphoesterase family protein